MRRNADARAKIVHCAANIFAFFRHAPTANAGEQHAQLISFAFNLPHQAHGLP
jgi:hypothetical protein